MEVVFFGPWTWLILMENTQKTPYLHVKHKNTRKAGVKMVENPLFSQIDKILKIVPRLDEYIWFPFFPGSRTDFKPPYCHILVSSKGDQTYYTEIFKIQMKFPDQETFFKLTINSEMITRSDLGLKIQWPPTSEPVIEPVPWWFQKTSKVPVKIPVV